MEAEELFIRHIDAIERIAVFMCRRYRLAEADIDDFIGFVKLELIERDYEIIRKFQGRSSFTTYLTTVIHRLLSQHRAQQWGRWRPTAEARRLGEKAMTLERLMTRDGFSFREAVGLLTTGCMPLATEAELEAIYFRLPHRTPRPQQLSGDLPHDAVASDDPSLAAMIRERGELARSAARVIEKIVMTFDDEEQRIVRERFWRGRTVAEIAAELQLDQKKTYKRLEKLLARLRAALEANGIHRIDLALLIGDGASPLDDRAVADSNVLTCDLAGWGGVEN